MLKIPIKREAFRLLDHDNQNALVAQHVMGHQVDWVAGPRGTIPAIVITVVNYSAPDTKIRDYMVMPNFRGCLNAVWVAEEMMLKGGLIVASEYFDTLEKVARKNAQFYPHASADLRCEAMLLTKKVIN